jgi:hypothetical protein
VPGRICRQRQVLTLLPSAWPWAFPSQNGSDGRLEQHAAGSRWGLRRSERRSEVRRSDGTTIGDVSAAALVEPGGSTFIREREFWSVSYAGSTSRLKDTKGLPDIARLLVEGDVGPVLNVTACWAYREQLQEPEEEFEEAEAANDPERVSRVRRGARVPARRAARRGGAGRQGSARPGSGGTGAPGNDGADQ